MPKRLTGGLLDFLDEHPDGQAPNGALILCGNCSTRKPPSLFYIPAAMRALADGRRINGNVARCRDCASAYSQARKAPRLAIVQAAKASGCVDCGLVDLNHPEIFDFDHVRGEKLANIATLSISGTLDQLHDELAKCEVVCANCHRMRTRARGPVTRGRDGRKPSFPVGSKRTPR